LIVAVSFVAVGTFWVLVTDVITYHVIRDHILHARVQTVIDCAFVALASVALYFVARTAASRLARAHALLIAIVDSIGDGVMVVGPDRKIVFANPAAQEMLGGDEVLGMGGLEFAQTFKVSRADGTLLRPEQLASQRAFDEPITHRLKEVLYPPGRERELVIRATGAPVHDPEYPVPQLVVSVMHDCTDAERFEAMRDQFMAAAAHYLKTPVAIIKANVQYMARMSPERDPLAMGMMQRQCARIDRLVQNLLVVARARSNSLQLHAHDMSLAPLVETMRRELTDAHNPRDVQLAIGAQPHVRGDQERLAIVTANLSQDALQHSQPRSVIRVNLEVTGIDAEIRVAYTPLPVTAQSFAGALEYDDTRLSRFATETIIKAHGGNCGVEMTDGVAELWVTLPVLRGDA
jgi:two-component system phosphate regulon sensor histidine kinase PhoR